MVFEVVEPVLRPVRRRQGARVFVRAKDKMLLIKDTDPGTPGSSWWVSPGGGVDAGEDWRIAASRELAEETGLEVNPDQLIGPVAHRLVSHGYSDSVLIQEEYFFLLDLDQTFEPSPVSFTEREKHTVAGYGWFDAAGLADLEIWPAETADFLKLNSTDYQLVEWGEVEESTVPVALGYQK